MDVVRVFSASKVTESACCEPALAEIEVECSKYRPSDWFILQKDQSRISDVRLAVYQGSKIEVRGLFHVFGQ